MKKFLIAVGLMLALGLMIGCAKEESVEAVDPIEQAWPAFRAEYGELESTEEKLPLIQAFMREHPDTEYAGMLAGAIAYYQGDEMEDPEGAYSLLAETLTKNTDPESRYQIGMAMFPLAVETGATMDLGAVAEELAATRELKFGEMIDVQLERSWGNYNVTLTRGTAYPTTPEALATLRDGSTTLPERAACELVGNGGELFVQLVQEDGKVLAEVSTGLRSLLTDADGKAEVQLPGSMSAHHVTLSLSAGKKGK